MLEQEPRLRPYARVPLELRERPQWVVWRPAADGETVRKVPLNVRTRGNAGVTWPDTWASFAAARELAVQQGFGLGYVLSEDDPFTCIDLDHCVGEGGEVSAETRAILDLLSGWTELSPSGSGLHIWVRNQMPVNRRTRPQGLPIEIYSRARWMTVTGRSNPNAPLAIPERTAEVAVLLQRYFPEEKREFMAPVQLPADDAIWPRLFDSPNGAFFKSLYAGDTSVCHNDHSRAVIMLANQLALMTQFDAARVKRLLYQTGLVTEKWEEKRGNQTWIEYQVQDAIRYVAGRKR